MRTGVILSALAVVTNAGLVPRQAAHFDSQGFPTTQGLTEDDPEFGILVDQPPNAVPRIVNLKPLQYPELGSKRIKVRYGPFRIPDMMSGDLGMAMEDEGGIVWNLGTKVPKPCDDCLITYMEAGLENMAGQTVNTREGLWLHHMVAMIQGKDHYDSVCTGNITSLPHLNMLWEATEAERFFSSGNERTPADFTRKSGKYGFHMAKEDKMGFIVDLMNTNMESHDVYMTMEWEYLSDKVPGFSRVKPVWLDITTCGVSDVDSPEGKTVFTLDSPTWTNKWLDGEVLGLGTHLHDGGVSVDVKRNGRTICHSEAKYGETEGYRSQPTRIANATLASMMDKDTMHISRQETCYDLGPIKKGDVFQLAGNYDYTKHPGMINSLGQPSDIMAISIMFVSQPMAS